MGRRTSRPVRPVERVATAVAATPARNTRPPSPATHADEGHTARALTSSAPPATSATAAARTSRRAGCPPLSAATKKGITPAIAVVAPPASARWSGSHGAAPADPNGCAIATTAARPRNPAAMTIEARAIRRSSARRGPGEGRAIRPTKIGSVVMGKTYSRLVIVTAPAATCPPATGPAGPTHEARHAPPSPPPHRRRPGGRRGGGVLERGRAGLDLRPCTRLLGTVTGPGGPGSGQR